MIPKIFSLYTKSAETSFEEQRNPPATPQKGTLLNAQLEVLRQTNSGDDRAVFRQCTTSASNVQSSEQLDILNPNVPSSSSRLIDQGSMAGAEASAESAPSSTCVMSSDTTRHVFAQLTDLKSKLNFSGASREIYFAVAPERAKLVATSVSKHLVKIRERFDCFDPKNINFYSDALKRICTLPKSSQSALLIKLVEEARLHVSEADCFRSDKFVTKCLDAATSLPQSESAAVLAAIAANGGAIAEFACAIPNSKAMMLATKEINELRPENREKALHLLYIQKERLPDKGAALVKISARLSEEIEKRSRIESDFFRFQFNLSEEIRSATLTHLCPKERLQSRQRATVLESFKNCDEEVFNRVLSYLKEQPSGDWIQMGWKVVREVWSGHDDRHDKIMKVTRGFDVEQRIQALKAVAEGGCEKEIRWALQEARTLPNHKKQRDDLVKFLIGRLPDRVWESEEWQQVFAVQPPSQQKAMFKARVEVLAGDTKNLDSDEVIRWAEEIIYMPVTSRADASIMFIEGTQGMDAKLRLIVFQTVARFFADLGSDKPAIFKQMWSACVELPVIQRVELMRTLIDLRLLLPGPARAALRSAITDGVNALPLEYQKGMTDRVLATRGKRGPSAVKRT